MANQVIEGDLSARFHEKPAGEMGELCQSSIRCGCSIAAGEQLKQVPGNRSGRARTGFHRPPGGGIAHEINNPLTGADIRHLLRQNDNFSDQDRGSGCESFRKQRA
jgi:hypothetical protein